MTKPWPDFEVQYLRDHVEDTPLKEIANFLKRPLGGVYHKASSLGISKDRIKARKVAKGRRPGYARDWRLRKLYDLEPEEFDLYWQACRGRCFICDKEMKWPEERRGQSLDVVAVDHDHVSGKMRGLLCNACNKGLGFFNDDIDVLRKAIRYLGGV